MFHALSIVRCACMNKGMIKVHIGMVRHVGLLDSVMLINLLTHRMNIVC
jgi:hypothetical protein